MQLILWRKQKLSSIIILCVVVIVILVCLRLGYWQLQRAENKALQLTQIAELQEQGVLSWKQMHQLPTKWNKTGLHVTVTGMLDTEQYWLLDNQVYQGQVGYDVVTLLKLTNSDDNLLVNLGWVKAPISREQLPLVHLPATPFTMTVQLKQGTLSGFTLQKAAQNIDSNWPKRIQIIDLALFTQQTGRNMVEFMGYRQGDGDNIAVPHYKAVVMSPEKHQAYAVQWFLIAVACLVIAIFASKKKEL